MRRISLDVDNLVRWVRGSAEWVMIILGAWWLGERFFNVFERLNLPTWARAIISVVLVIMAFVVVGYVLNRRKGKLSGKDGVMVSEQGQEPTIIKDTRIRVDAEKASKATGMNIHNVQSELSDVQINVKAKDVEEVKGLNITAEDSRFALKAKTITCSCGYVIRSVSTCGYEPIIKCPKCGKEYSRSEQ